MRGFDVKLVISMALVALVCGSGIALAEAFSEKDGGNRILFVGTARDLDKVPLATAARKCLRAVGFVEGGAG